MVGVYTDKEKLNRTLEKVCVILRENNINDWFIFFGTLLGVVRENSCIQGDDDLDIMINHDCQKLISILEKEGFKFSIKNPDKILKTIPCDIYSSIDFYMCEVKLKNYFTPWQNVEIQNVEIESKKWRSAQINLPKNSDSILKKLYGQTWQTPIQYKFSDKLSMAEKGGFYNQKIYTLI